MYKKTHIKSESTQMIVIWTAITSCPNSFFTIFFLVLL